MTKQRIPSAKDWRNRPISSWNVTTFTEYLRDRHRELFVVTYAPHGGRWGMEQGILGDLIGTQSRTNPKPRTASNEAVKRFIDETFEDYKPTAQYPGTSFGFMWTYRKAEWQRIEAEEARKKGQSQVIEEQPSHDELAEWL